MIAQLELMQPTPGKSMCRHCGTRAATRTIGLCSRCFGVKTVRGHYASVDRGQGIKRSVTECGRRGVSVENRKPMMPLEPTEHLPGTGEKILVMMERARDGYHLHHPDDATWESVEVDEKEMRSVLEDGAGDDD